MASSLVRLPPCVSKETRQELKKMAISHGLSFQQFLNNHLTQIVEISKLHEQHQKEVCEL